MIDNPQTQSLKIKRPGAPSINLGLKTLSFGSLSNINIGGKAGNESMLSNELVSKESKFKFKKEDIEIIARLGAGSGGSVHKVFHKPTQMTMACKVLNVLLRLDD